jgi:dihydrofolate reductase
MRRVWYSVAASLDGYIAGPRGEFDWIPDEPAIDWGAFMARFDTVLMGRGTFEAALRQGRGGGVPGMTTYVFSRTLRPADHPDVTVVAGDAAGVVAGLRRGAGKDIWLMGGGVLFQCLLDAGLVDRVEAGVIPILLGGGIPLLPGPARRTRLAFTDIERYPGGILKIGYDVVRDDA